MLNNYSDSMERKRFFFIKPQKYKEDYISREKLEKLVWEMPMKYIAKELNITTDYVKKSV
ncbi:MAG: hypothetical protein ACFFAN_00205 [Promethearchaeota archaeon]